MSLNTVDVVVKTLKQLHWNSSKFNNTKSSLTYLQTQWKDLNKCDRKECSIYSARPNSRSSCFLLGGAVVNGATLGRGHACKGL